MPMTKNAVYFDKSEDYIRFVIKMVHPKLYVSIFAFLCILSILGTLSLIVIFNIFAALGPSSLLVLALGLLVSFGFFKIYRWHHNGEEFFILTKDNFSYQINNGIKLSGLKTFTAKDYRIGFHKTNTYESSPCGKIYFYETDPDTKLTTIILDSTLEIALDEYTLLEENYLQITQKPLPFFDFNLN